MTQQTSTIPYQVALSRTADYQRAARLLGALVLAWLPAIIDHEAVGRVAALHAWADSPSPYFIPAYAGLLYVWSPLVVASACILFLSPGLLLALALDMAKDVGRWLLYGFVFSLIINSVAAGAGQAILGAPLRGMAFLTIIVACAVICGGLLLGRLRRSSQPSVWPLADQPYAAGTLLTTILVPLAILIGLTPKFYWEVLNGDGAHTFETTRLLFFQPVPFWPPAAGPISGFPGFSSLLYVYPGSWFMRLFGESEAAVRLPLLLYLVPLYGVILSLAEFGQKKTLGMAERGLIWIGIVAYVITMAFSATYDPYSSDIALPATQDTLLMVCFLGFVLSFIQKSYGWTAGFVGLTYMTSPGGLMLIGLWLVAVMLAWQARPWRQVAFVVAVVVGCMVSGLILTKIFTALNMPPPGGEHGFTALLKRLRYLQWGDWGRLAFLIVPALSLMLWWRQDRVARAVTLLTVSYFLFFFVQAYVSLHYFVPVMILPLVVFWRYDWLRQPRYRSLTLAGVGVAGLVALMLSLPQEVRPDTSARYVGAAIENRVGGYDQVGSAAIRSSSVLWELFEPGDPTKSYFGSPLVWNRYAHLDKNGTVFVNYIIQPATDAAPPDTRLVAQEDDAALYVKDELMWENHRALRPSTATISSIYAIPRPMLFRGSQYPPDLTLIDVKTILEPFLAIIRPGS